MSQPITIDQAFALALQHHQAGNLDAARSIYEQILAAAPQHAESLHLLGVIATQQADYPRSIDLISRALALAPNTAHFHSNLGEAHRRAGNLDPAIAAFKKSLALHEPFPDAWLNLGLALNAAGRHAEARDAFIRLTQLAPQNANAFANLADALARLGDRDTATRHYQHALTLDPRCALALNNLANFHTDAGRLDDAQNLYNAALQVDPRDPVALQNLGSILVRRRNFVNARPLYEHFAREHPQSLDALRGLAGVYRELARFDESAHYYKKAIELAPDEAFLHANLAASLRDAGQHEEAAVEFHKALELGPDEPAIHSAYILTQYLLPGVTQESVDAEKERWDLRHARPLAPQNPTWPNTPDPDRPLRIGYVSPDLRIHPVGRFMLPLIRAHDPRQVAITCYATSPAQDAYSASIREIVDAPHHGGWRTVDTLLPADLAQKIRDDRIDILVDLSMHTVGNRLLTFALRPAPLQLSYLAYADGTGLSAIDAHLTDALLEPPGPRDAAPYDRPLRLPHTYWCYAPHPSAPDVSPLPALSGKPFTFGCLNHFAKVSLPTFAAWADILRATAAQNSRLLLHVPPGNGRTLVHQRMAAVGIGPERVDFLPTSTLEAYLESHSQIDIALDPFPYVGGTTTCDALWMGVPVISLAGPPNTPATSRAGLSILTTLGLPHLAPNSLDDYIHTAAKLAADLPTLAALRATLRPRMQTSPLTNITAFAHDIESTYRTLWREWCALRH